MSIRQSNSEAGAAFRRRSRAILVALFFPTMAMILSGSMFGVALPTVRDEFGMTADVAAWLNIAFSLPFMMFMPLYGRLGDELGKSPLLFAGILVFAAGSLLAMTAPGLPFIFLGRLIQGAGAAGITPLSLAIIAERFSEQERGRAMGIWNSVAPATSIFAPSIGGFLIDSAGWRTIFLPVLVIGVVAMLIVRIRLPTLRSARNWAALRAFDWVGAILMGGTIAMLVFFVSSRPITGVEPLRDMRLAAGVLFCFSLFIFWENRRHNPLIDLEIFRVATFRSASIAAAFRMSMMVGIAFVLPLYLADLYDLNASTIGLLASLHSIALFLSIRMGASVADRWSNRWLVAGSLAMQVGMMSYYALLPEQLPLFWIAVGNIGHGFGAGVSLAALHRTALGDIAPEQTGSAAGVYSMVRFAGSMLATALAGALLQFGFDSGYTELFSYQSAFGFLAAMGVIGIWFGSRLR